MQDQDADRHIKRLAELYSPDEAGLWLCTEHPLLGGERPMDVIRDGRTNEVLSVIESMLEGSYT